MTLCHASIQPCKGETNSISFADLSFVYFVFGHPYSSYFVSFVELFHLSRILQTLLMGQYVLLSPHGNKKLQALLRGTFLHRMFLFSSSDDLVSLVRSFHVEQAIYLRFSHIPNFQPKFYIGSRSSTILDREHSRYRKFIQVQQNKFVLAEVALRFLEQI